MLEVPERSRVLKLDTKSNPFSSGDIITDLRLHNTSLYGKSDKGEHESEPLLGVVDRCIEKNSSRTTVNWGLVRIFGELQILSKASYLLLVLVPILAGLWPAFSGLINRTAHSATNLASQISQVEYGMASAYRANLTQQYFPSAVLLSLPADATQLDQTAPPWRIGYPKLVGDSRDAEGKYREEKLASDGPDSSESDYLVSPKLPVTWALSFLASLFVIFAQIIYQLSTKELVRKYSLRAFIFAELADEYDLGGAKADLKREDVEEHLNRKIAEYSVESNRKKAMAILSLTFYLASIFILVIILFIQSGKVFSAAGW